MRDDELKALCDRAVERIHAIPFSDWPEPGLLAGVLFEVFAPHCGLSEPEGAT